MKSAAKTKKPVAKPLAKAAPKVVASKPGRGLGKGLSALMSDSYSQVPERAPQASGSDEVRVGTAELTLSVEQIRSGKYQPRGYFDETALGELSDSIRKNGLMQPILVRPLGNEEYEIIAGERRWRAAKMAGLSEVPVFIREIGDEQALELALIENVQRADLHPLEEAGGYQRLVDEFGYTQDDLSRAVAKSRSHIANLLRLLMMPKEIRSLFADNKLTMGHARALMGLPDDKAIALSDEVVRRGLNVRQTEKHVRADKDYTIAVVARNMRGGASVDRGKPMEPPAIAEAPQPQVPVQQQYYQAPQKDKDPDVIALEETLSENLGLRVSIEDRGQSGQITIAYESLEQLDEILRRLGGSI